MTDISGPLAHQLPLHNHRGGLVQPSLVMNHHLDMGCHGNDTRISKLIWYFVDIFRCWNFACIANIVWEMKTRYLFCLFSIVQFVIQKYKRQFDMYFLVVVVVITCEDRLAWAGVFGNRYLNCDCAWQCQW